MRERDGAMADRPRQTYQYQQGNQPGKCSVKRGKEREREREREREDPQDPRIKKAETQVHLAAAVLSFEAQVVVTKESRERRAPRATSSFQFGVGNVKHSVVLRVKAFGKMLSHAATKRKSGRGCVQISFRIRVVARVCI